MDRLKRILKKISKLLFNRIIYVIVAVSLQISWFVVLVVRLAGYSIYIDLAISLGAILIVFLVINREMNPSYKLLWTFLILGLPVFGLVIYLLAGESRRHSIFGKKYSKSIELEAWELSEDAAVRESLEKLDTSANRQSLYIRNVAKAPLWQHTVVEYYRVGDDVFPVLVKELRRASRFIFMEYFIINEGVMWETILEILKEKARDGVDVRLIYDDFGCMTTLPIRYYEELNAVGIRCEVFNPFRLIANVLHNNRDHRKLCIIDGYVGFTGGVNLSDEYINQRQRFGYWKDTAIMLRGDAVWNMTEMFLQMWAAVSRDIPEESYDRYRPHSFHLEPFPTDGYIQPFGDSPLDNDAVSENVYLSILTQAKKYVYICTPYLIVDNEMMTALCLAAQSGIDVRIITPGIPDKKLVFLLTQSYYSQLLRAGVKIYKYQPGFLHAKSVVCDDTIAVCGTINLDFRSLFLHFEDGVWMYGSRSVTEIRNDFLETLPYCEQESLDSCLNRNIFFRAVQSAFRLFAPLI